MAEERVQRRLAAIVSADVVGYSRMMGKDEAGTLARLKALRSEFLHPKVAEHGGQRHHRRRRRQSRCPTRGACRAGRHVRRVVDDYSDCHEGDLAAAVKFASQAIALDDADAIAHFVLGAAFAYLRARAPRADSAS
jgi:class 3 adenylate cyclase